MTAILAYPASFVAALLASFVSLKIRPFVMGTLAGFGVTVSVFLVVSWSFETVGGKEALGWGTFLFFLLCLIMPGIKRIITLKELRKILFERRVSGEQWFEKYKELRTHQAYFVGTLLAIVGLAMIQIL